MEIIVGTSVGFVYVLDATGAPRPGWPLQMGEVQGQGGADLFIPSLEEMGLAEERDCGGSSSYNNSISSSSRPISTNSSNSSNL